MCNSGPLFWAVFLPLRMFDRFRYICIYTRDFLHIQTIWLQPLSGSFKAVAISSFVFIILSSGLTLLYLQFSGSLPSHVSLRASDRASQKGEDDDGDQTIKHVVEAHGRSDS